MAQEDGTGVIENLVSRERYEYLTDGMPEKKGDVWDTRGSLHSRVLFFII